MENEYFYKGNFNLNKNYDDELINYNSIFICPFIINNTSLYPFMQFLLIKNFFELDFIEIPIFHKMNSYEFLNSSTTFLFNLIHSNDKNFIFNNIDFKGFFEYNNNLYLFYDLTKCELSINDIYFSNNLWLTLMDEILNQKHLCNIKINKNIINFFTYNDSFCFLLDKENNSYEIPITGFVSKEEKKLNFTYIFGEPRSDLSNIFGPFYYFTNFYDAFKTSLNLDKTLNYNSKNGLVRFALFTGKTKYIENHPNDDMDVSFTKQQRLKVENLENLEKNIEMLTMRITDYDGNWSKQKFDSVYLGNIELDNGTFWDKSIIVLKEYIQQAPLSFHYIDKKSFNDKNLFLIS